MKLRLCPLSSGLNDASWIVDFGHHSPLNPNCYGGYTVSLDRSMSNGGTDLPISGLDLLQLGKPTWLGGSVNTRWGCTSRLSMVRLPPFPSLAY